MAQDYWPHWVTYYVLSQDPDVADNNTLGMLSSGWNQTKDSFERKAMKAKELEAIDQKVEALRKV